MIAEDDCRRANSSSSEYRADAFAPTPLAIIAASRAEIPPLPNMSSNVMPKGSSKVEGVAAGRSRSCRPGISRWPASGREDISGGGVGVAVALQPSEHDATVGCDDVAAHDESSLEDVQDVRRGNGASVANVDGGGGGGGRSVADASSMAAGSRELMLRITCSKSPDIADDATTSVASAAAANAQGRRDGTAAAPSASLVAVSVVA